MKPICKNTGETGDIYMQFEYKIYQLKASFWGLLGLILITN